MLAARTLAGVSTLVYSLTASSAAVLPVLQEQDMQEQALIQQVCTSLSCGCDVVSLRDLGCLFGRRTQGILLRSGGGGSEAGGGVVEMHVDQEMIFQNQACGFGCWVCTCFHPRKHVCWCAQVRAARPAMRRSPKQR